MTLPKKGSAGERPPASRSNSVACGLVAHVGSDPVHQDRLRLKVRPGQQITIAPALRPPPGGTSQKFRDRRLFKVQGVAPDHVERALGHVILGVRGVYDRHDYHAEKRAAFEALAARLDLILNPQPNVVQLRSGKMG